MTKILEFRHQSFHEYSGLISLKTDWFDLLAVQGTFRSLQHHGLKASVLCPAAFIMVQLSQSYVTTGKTIALMIWTFVSRVMSLLFYIVHPQKLCRSCYSPDTSLGLLFSKCGSENNNISIIWKCVLKTYPRLTECENQKVGFSSMYVAIPICMWYTA